MTVNLTRIYTRLGDSGETHLADMSRVSKTDPRIEVDGNVDELNSHLGLTLLAPDLPARYVEWLRRVQNDLFDVGADCSMPSSAKPGRLRIAPEQIVWLEARCDEVGAAPPALRTPVLPRRTVAAGRLHLSRAVCRRAERAALRVGDDFNPEIVRYLNRLSDLLGVLARGAEIP